MLVWLNNGSAVLLQGDVLSMTLGVATAAAEQLMTAPARSAHHRIAACCLQRDETGWMAAATTTGAAAAAGKLAEAGDGAEAGAGGGEGGGEGGERVFVWICRSSGGLECYSLPDMELVWQGGGLAGGVDVLRPGPAALALGEGVFGGQGEQQGKQEQQQQLVELRVEAFKVCGCVLVGASQVCISTMCCGGAIEGAWSESWQQNKPHGCPCRSHLTSERVRPAIPTGASVPVAPWPGLWTALCCFQRPTPPPDAHRIFPPPGACLGSLSPPFSFNTPLPL